MAFIYVSPMSAQVYANPLHRFNRGDKEPKKIIHIFEGLYTKIGKTSGDCRSRNYSNSHFYAYALAEDDVIAIENIGRDNFKETDDFSKRYIIEHYDDLLQNLYAWEIETDYWLMDSIEKLSQYLAKKRYGLASPRFKYLNSETNEWLISSYSGYTETYNCTVMQARKCVLEATEKVTQGIKKLAA